VFRFASAVAALTTVLVVIATTRAHSATCTTTVSSVSAVASAVSSAPVGSTICMADGTYGQLTLNATKAAPGVTVRAANPGKATIAGASLTGSYITIAQFRITGTFDPRPGSTGMAADHNLFVGGNYFAVMDGASTTETTNDVTITNNRFDGRFNEDAIRLNRYHDGPDADPYGVLIEGNEFSGNVEYGGHNDVVQSVYVGDHLYFRKNYLQDFGGQGFFIKDQASAIDTLVVEDNLIVRQDLPCDPASLCPGWEPSPFQIYGPSRNVSIRHNTVWPGKIGGGSLLRGSGWQGPTVFSDNVMDNLGSDATDLTTNYTASNNTRCSGTGFPTQGVATDCNPAFIDAANGDYRQANGRGVDWKLSDMHFGPYDDGGGSTPPPPPNDTTPPETTISSGPSGSTTSTSATFAFSSSESGSTFACKLDAADYAACTSPKSYSGLGAGDHTFSVRATDQAGNTDQSPATRTWTVGGPTDTTPPDTTITAGPSGPTNDTTPTFSFNADQAGSTFACRVDGAAYATCTSPWTTAALTAGGHSVSVRATDPAGNTDQTPATRAFSIDTTPPKTTITDAPPAQTDATDASVTFTVDETGSTSECRLDAGAWTPCSSPFKATGLAPGSHTVGVRSTDPAGNVESPGASATWTVGSGGGGGNPPPTSDAPPSIALTAPTVGATVSGWFRITADADDDHGIDHVELWLGGTRLDRDSHAPYTTGADASGLRSGTYTVSARAFDAVGQSASAAQTVRVARRGRRSQGTSGWAQLASVAGDGITHLTGQTVRSGDVRVNLTPCSSSRGVVVDSFTLHADQNGHLDATYASANRCVLRLDPM
jgi:Bacterial Ig domain/Bacterial Ig-like domain